VDYGSYASELHRYSNLQLAHDKKGAVAARYWWVFPNLMLNFYPWGLSLNVVEPSRSTAPASPSGRSSGTSRSSRPGRGRGWIASRPRTRRSSRRSSGACARGSTGRGGIRPLASGACTISIVCCANSWNNVGSNWQVIAMKHFLRFLAAMAALVAVPAAAQGVSIDPAYSKTVKDWRVKAEQSL